MLRLCATCAFICLTGTAPASEPWPLHIIDNSSRGADGVRLADVDRDGRSDITTGWEEGGQIRICFQPEQAAIRAPWPSIQVGAVRSPEDAVVADVNDDGWPDVISCCEGSQQTVFFHISPGGSADRVRNSEQWSTIPLDASAKVTRWMFCAPLGGRELILGSKDPRGQITRLTSQASSTEQFEKLRDAGWIMSLRPFDVDRDGDSDVIYSDRKGASRGIGWLEQTSGEGRSSWVDHAIGGDDFEVMFLDVMDLNGKPVIACNTRNDGILWMTPNEIPAERWSTKVIMHPPGVGGGKGIAIGDIDRDGQLDLACTCEHSEDKVGVFWLGAPASASERNVAIGTANWQFHDISGREPGVKFDRIELLDLDQDGDLDLVTCEERNNLGVIWYENQ